MRKVTHAASLLLFLLSLLLVATNGNAATDISDQKSSAPMDNDRLKTLISRIDKDFKGRPGYWQFSVEERTVTVITDDSANRMRIISGVTKVDKLEPALMMRLLQANFDSALDARYAVANGVLWSAYIHPLSSLQDKQFLEAVGQVVNLTSTFGSSYSSGALIFNGGDSKEIQRRDLIDKLIEKGMAI